MIEQNAKRGIWLMMASVVIFSAQDGITRHLTVLYPVQMVVMPCETRSSIPTSTLFFSASDARHNRTRTLT